MEVLKVVRWPIISVRARGQGTMQTATEAEGGIKLDAREASERIIERLVTGHGHKTWGRQGRFVHSGKPFQVTSARFGHNCCDMFKLSGNYEDDDGMFGWKADVNHMEVHDLPHGLLLIDKLHKHPPIVLAL